MGKQGVSYIVFSATTAAFGGFLFGYDTAVISGAIGYLEKVFSLTLATDVRAAYDGDPAAKSYDEIIYCYPGLYAVAVYRVAHQLYQQQVPLMPRIMTDTPTA